MKTSFYLKVNSRGGITTAKNRPGLDWDEVAISVNMEIPDMLFKKPQLNAPIVVPEIAAVPKEIDAEMCDNIQSAIETAVGLQL